MASNAVDRSGGGRIALEKSCVLAQKFCVAHALSLDEFDHRLLAALQRDAAITLTALGDAVGLSASAVQRRLVRYRKAGLLRQVAVLDADLLPAVTLVAVWLQMESDRQPLHKAFRARMRAAPEVQQCYAVAGPWDYLVILAATGVAHYREIAARLFVDEGTVKRYETQLIFDVVKQGLALPTRAAPRGRK
ncbi:MAG: Lrp/AsnC family transcriptional regulator [Proteobacteria bacterium]|nr:Lrp/AsnC family transcriptional regulator [Pseudomonadota bacterium]MBS0464200.1 Lrp/AsnC family transcriptional regulator [Pseudomonadota bacterium]